MDSTSFDDVLVSGEIPNWVTMMLHFRQAAADLLGKVTFVKLSHTRRIGPHRHGM